MGYVDLVLKIVFIVGYCWGGGVVISWDYKVIGYFRVFWDNIFSGFIVVMYELIVDYEVIVLVDDVMVSNILLSGCVLEFRLGVVFYLG